MAEATGETAPTPIGTTERRAADRVDWDIPGQADGRAPPRPASPRRRGPLATLADVVARINAGVHAKLLSGFLAGALLLLGMAVVSLVVIDRMSQRVADITRLQDKVDRLRQMEYLVTAQSHFRAMALLTGDESNNEKISNAKDAFSRHLNAVDRLSGPEQADFFRRLREGNARFTVSSERILVLQKAGNVDEALRLHLAEEHPISHVLEDATRELQAEALKEMSGARAAFESDRQLLTTMVGVFSGVSLALAVLLGVILSSAFVQPVRTIDRALAGLASGNFAQRVDVPNRDEFGTLGKNLNLTSSQLSNLYSELRSLNADLESKVKEQLAQLERASTLKRYLSPQLSEAILSGEAEVNLASRRKNLTIFFSDVRGFTAMSERLEPEDLVGMLNEYLTAMTDIVFDYGGTLDKYIGDAIMVFFGDPVSYEDHAARAVKMALDMRSKLGRIHRRWSLEKGETLSVGMGISTGYVTVGNIGSSARLEYTVLGNHVNLASRLADRAEGGQILISERTLASVRELVYATEIDEVELEGVSRPIKIYEINEK